MPPKMLLMAASCFRWYYSSFNHFLLSESPRVLLQCLADPNLRLECARFGISAHRKARSSEWKEQSSRSTILRNTRRLLPPAKSVLTCRPLFGTRSPRAIQVRSYAQREESTTTVSRHFPSSNGCTFPSS